MKLANWLISPVLHICANELDLGNWISIASGNDWLPVLCQAIKSSWLIVNCILGNKLQWYLNQKRFIYENAFEYVFCEIEAILSRVRWVKSVPQSTNLCTWLHVYMASTRLWHDRRSVEQSRHHCGVWLRCELLKHNDWAMPLQWLQIPWHRIGARSSATTMLIRIMVILCVTSIMLHSLNNF